MRTVPESIAVDSGSNNSAAMRDAVARISGRQNATSSNNTTNQGDQNRNPRRTPMAELRSDLNKMLEKMEEARKEEEDTQKAMRLQSLMSARNIAEKSMGEHETEARKADPGSNKRKRHVNMFKHHKQEWLHLTRQTSMLQELSFDENDYDYDLSFSDEDSE